MELLLFLELLSLPLYIHYRRPKKEKTRVSTKIVATEISRPVVGEGGGQETRRQNKLVDAAVLDQFRQFLRKSNS